MSFRPEPPVAEAHEGIKLAVLSVGIVFILTLVGLLAAGSSVVQ
ncbi:hypothetical protein [Marinobacter sp.]